MPEPTTGAGDAQGAAQAPTTQPQGGDAQQAQGASADKGPDVAELQRHIDKLERENADYRAKVRNAAQDGEKAKSLEERLAAIERENGELKSRERENRVADAIKAAAAKAGYRNPDVAVGLVRSSIELDEDGTPRHVERAVNDLLAREPYLGKPTTPDAGGGPRGKSTGPTDPSTSDLIRAALTGR